MNTLALLLANVTANTGAHVCLKKAAISSSVKHFLFWKVVGNLAAFLGTVAYTMLLRGMSLHVAYPLTEGLGAVSVQVVGAAVLFKEHVTPLAWAGTGLILSGIVLFSL
jgi:multidrug transporter EmrE-like cation transporter